jgi:iron complex outermembrane receptor protein
MDFRTQCRVWTFMVYLLATPLVRAATDDPETPPVEFHIQGGDATTTLTEFSRQAHLQLLFDYNVVKGHTTKPLDGVLQPAEALRRLLANSDLEFDFVNERTLAVMQRRVTPEDSRPHGELKPQKQSTRPAKTNRPAPDAAGDPEEVVRITGTYIRDTAPVGQELISANRDEIEAAGTATPADFLSTLPQTFGGGPNQDTHIGQEALTNSGLGVGENLRGLGARATLILINGRRIAPSGTEGEFVDIENIPMSAIERIDILPDSASAIYGADAVGGVVNFVLRNKLDGAETVARGGSGTRGDLQEYLFSQTVGKSWDEGSGLLSFEFYRRGPLPAADRSYAVSDLRPFGGADFDTNLTNPGNIISLANGQTWAIPHGQNGMHLTAADLVAGSENLQNQYLDAQIIPSQERWNLYGTGRRAFGDRVSLFTDVLLGHRQASETYAGLGAGLLVPSTNPFYVNPTGGTAPVEVGYNFGKDLGHTAADVGVDTLNATLGLNLDVGAAWTASAYGSFAREKQNQISSGQLNFNALAVALADPNPLTAFNPYGDGSYTSAATLDTLRANDRFWMNSQLKTFDVIADGPVGKLAGIPFKLAVGADWRHQDFTTSSISPTAATAGNAKLSRTVLSAFGQLVAPIFTEKNALPAFNTLELSAAARYEDYTSYGGGTTPKYGIVWSPLQGLAFRGTWSRATRPPTLIDLDETGNQSLTLPLQNRTAPAGYTNTLIWSGNNATVRPERANSWTTGLDFTPQAVPGLSLGITYFRTLFKDRIQSTLYTPTVLNDPGYAAIVTRNPTAAQINYICSHSLYREGTVSDCMAAPIGAIVDLRVRNLAQLLTDGIDFNSRYQRPTSFGKLEFGVSGTWLRNFSEAQTPDEPLVSLLNTQNEPINLRLRATAGWQYRGWGTLVAANFTNSYRDIASIPQRRIDAWTTVDLQLRYDFPEDGPAWLQGIRLELNARNLFNVDPPFLNNQAVDLAYDQENANPYGRVLSLQVRKTL